jgi:DeoR/GlpR family transcriptional regulator of sugar metabolism
MSESSSGRSASDSQKRLDWLRTQLAEAGSVTIVGAVEALGASAMTIRRDLATLQALGEARRVRGGAQALGPSLFRTRSPRNARAKIVIAEKVLPMVPPTGAIAIDSSSTMACLANVLASARDLLVITNGLEVFDVLQGRPGIRALLTGGERDERTSSLVGPVACAAAGSFRYDVAFLSAAAVDPRIGGLEATPEEASIVQAFARQSSCVVLGVDSSKLDSDAPVVGLRWEQIDVVVTELSPENERLSAIRGRVPLS